MCSANRGEKGATDPLELESQETVSCQVSAGNQTPIRWKSGVVLLTTGPPLQVKQTQKPIQSEHATATVVNWEGQIVRMLDLTTSANY